MKKVVINEEQKKELKKAIAAQDQVGGKVNAGIMDGVCGAGVCENAQNSNLETWYRGYNSRYGSQRDHLLWLTDDIDYAKVYGNRVEEVIIDGNKTNPIEIDDSFDYIDGPGKEQTLSFLKDGYNCYYFEQLDNFLQ